MSVEGDLEKICLRMQPYWSAKYLKNIDKWSKPLYKIKEERDVYIVVRDGTKLCADIFRPDAEGKFPALIAWSSYGKSQQSHRRDPRPAGSLLLDHSVEVPDIDFFVTRGYAFIIPEPRGVGKSEGEWHGMFSPQEQKDLYDVIEWVAEQPWCNGNVGMIGVSYFGHIQILAAKHQPPHLKAIMPYPVFDPAYYFAYPGGILNDFLHGFILINNPNNAIAESEKLYTKEELKRRIRERLLDPYVSSNTYYVKILNTWPPRYNTWFFDVLLHPLDGPFWQSRSAEVNKVKIPTYLVDGYLLNPMMINRVFVELKVPKKLFVVGKYQDESMHDCPYRYTQEEALRWYDYWLKGIDTGIMDEPPIKIWVNGVRRYRFEYEWPLARTKWTKFYLGRYHKLQADPESDVDVPPDTFVHNPHELRTLQLDVPSVCYSTEPLNKPLEITGPIALYLYASIDQQDGNFIINLYDVSPAGTKTLVGAGVLKVSHRTIIKEKSKPWLPIHDHTKEKPVKPGEINEYVIGMTTSNVFQKDHCMLLEIKAAAPQLPRYTGYTTIGLMPSPCITVYKIYHDKNYPSHLLLPVISETPEELWIN